MLKFATVSALSVTAFLATSAEAATSINSSARRWIQDARVTADVAFDGTGNTAGNADGSTFRVGQVGVNGAENGLRNGLIQFTITNQTLINEIVAATTTGGGSIKLIVGKNNAQAAPQPQVDFVLLNTGTVDGNTAVADAGLIGLYEASGFAGASFNFAINATPEVVSLDLTDAFRNMIAANSNVLPTNFGVRMQPGNPAAYNTRDTLNDNILFFAGTTFTPTGGSPVAINRLEVVIPEPASLALLALGGAMLAGRRRR